jgi:hypothetical protein
MFAPQGLGEPELQPSGLDQIYDFGFTICLSPNNNRKS